MEWFYANENDEQISFPENDFSELVRRGEIKRDTLVWNETLSDWTECGPLKPELFHEQSSPAPLQVPATPAALDLPNSEGGASQYFKPAASPSVPAVTPGQSSVQKSPAEGLAVASLICGIIGVVLCGWGLLLSIAAVICAHVGRRKLREAGFPPSNGMLTAGMILGWIGIALSILGIVAVIASVVAEGIALQ